MVTCDAVVVGAGFAGAATAYHLTRMGLRDLVILEQEPTPGVHASGRNAAMARQTLVSPDIAPLAAETVALMREPPADLSLPSVLRACGMLVVVDEPEVGDLRGHPGWQDAGAVAVRVPAAVGGAFVGGVLGPQDGVVDIGSWLSGFLRAACASGARLRTGERVVAIRTRGKKVTTVETTQSSYETGAVVNAAGAWAGVLGALAGAPAVRLEPRRRHLFVSARLDWVDPAWPIVWDVSHGLYFRPEPPGLLLCPCDETPHAPGEAPVDEAAQELLASKVRRFMPGLGDVGVARSWACLRTLTPDGNFLIGRDPWLENLIWCAGLGGHGVTVSAAAGRLAAEAVLGRPSLAAHDPRRFEGAPPAA